MTAGIHRRIFETACGQVTQAARAAAVAPDAMLQLVPAAAAAFNNNQPDSRPTLDGTDWNALYGKRVQYVRANVMSMQQDFKAVLLAFLVLASETVTHSLFKAVLW